MVSCARVFLPVEPDFARAGRNLRLGWEISMVTGMSIANLQTFRQEKSNKPYKTHIINMALASQSSVVLIKNEHY